jgi:hypothetical protein
VHGGVAFRGWEPQATPVPTGTRKQNSRHAPRVDHVSFW